jgi:hypothetical protein
MTYGIFDDYMGVQYREGADAAERGLAISACPYEVTSQMGQAWREGYFDQDSVMFNRIKYSND